MEHEIAAVQVLHHEEKVGLKQRSLELVPKIFTHVFLWKYKYKYKYKYKFKFKYKYKFKYIFTHVCLEGAK